MAAVPSVRLALMLTLAPGEVPSEDPHPDSATFVEDMPDPEAETWEPPTGPAPKPTPEPTRVPAPGYPTPPPPSVSTVSELHSSGPVPAGSPTARQHGQRLQVAGIVFGVGGAIGLAVGFYLNDEANKTRAELEVERLLLEVGASMPSTVSELESKLRSERTAMTASLIAGGSSLALGTVLFIAGTFTKRRAQSPIVSISAGRAFAGLTVAGRF